MRFGAFAASLGMGLVLLAGCRADESLNPPNLSNNQGLLQRYVAMGNSITAGFQSAGINDSTQRQSYAVVFARQARAPFFVPLLTSPGCPPPFLLNAVTPQIRVGGGTSGSECHLRTGNPLPYLSNVAVPGAHVIDALNNFATPSNSNQLTQLILGGRTQVQAMEAANPTFVSVWLGNNDVLGALTGSNPGDPTLITPQAEFEAAYGALLDSIDATGAKAALIGVADVTVIPYGSAGSTYWCLKTGLCPGVPGQLAPIVTLTVSNNCAPASAVPGSKGDSTLIPWTIGVTKIGAAQQGVPQTIDCSVDQEVVTPSELTQLAAAVQSYNGYIESQAETRGWAYVDMNPALRAARQDPAQIAPFPNLPADPSTTPITFGSLFSLDAVHPSGAGQRLVADSLISAVNRTYGTAIPFAGP